MSIEDYAEGARRVVTAIACESHRPVRPEEGCPWCEIARLRAQLSAVKATWGVFEATLAYPTPESEAVRRALVEPGKEEKP